MQIFNIKYKSKGYISLRKKEEGREGKDPTIDLSRTKGYTVLRFPIVSISNRSLSLCLVRFDETRRGWRIKKYTTKAIDFAGLA